MLIIEIILTIFAWRNGWKWRSLIPVGIAILIELSVGFGIGSAGGSVSGVSPSLFFVDFCAIIALVVLICKKPKSLVKTEEPKNNL
jgi:hypothetical protein